MPVRAAIFFANSVASMSVEITASAKNECVPPWFALGVNSLTLYLTLLIVVSFKWVKNYVYLLSEEDSALPLGSSKNYLLVEE
jgi:hypothetical protein